MISCIIHTRNSAVYLHEVLRSVAWCDEVIIVDMESTDETVRIARDFGARVENHAFVGLADPARSFGLSLAKGDWVLSVDSDEIIPAALARRLREIEREDEADVVDLCFRNFFFGREIVGSGWSWKNIVVTRFFRKGFVNYGSEVHDFIRIQSGARRVKLIRRDLAVIHFNYSDVRQFIEKLNRYTDFEAGKLTRGGPFRTMLFQALRELGGRFVVLGGWRDGWVGFYLSLGMVFYRLSAIAKCETGTRADIDAAYLRIAQGTEVLRGRK